MALPRSTFVMGVAVAVVLGLAIRGTVHRGHVATPAEEEEAQRRAAQAAEVESDSEREDVRRRNAERDELIAWAKALVGAEVATFGGSFAGTSLPATRDALYAEVMALSTTRRARVEQLSFGDQASVDSLAFDVLPDADRQVRRAACNALDRELNVAWGHGTPTGGDTQVWLNAPRRLRVSFTGDGDTCRLQFEHVLAADAWVAQTAGFVGKRPAEAPMQIAWFRPDRGSGTAPGAGVASTPTDIELWLKGEKIVGEAATVTTDSDTRAAIVAELTKQLGKPSGDADNMRWRDVRLVRIGSKLRLTRGETP